MTQLNGLLDAILHDPQAEDRWQVLADWLEEYDDPRRGELLRRHRQLLNTCCEPERHPERAVWQARVVELLAEGVRPCVPQQTVVLRKGVEMTFSFIPPGRFLMGSPPDEPERLDEAQNPRDYETQHRVTLTKGFWLGAYPVTQEQWRLLMNFNPSYFSRSGRGRDSIRDIPDGELEQFPVEEVCWDDCEHFCWRLSNKEKAKGRVYRLPTEAEWEYACRAGTTTPFFFGDTLSTDQANYDGSFTYGPGEIGEYRQETTPVDSFAANAWGLHDMHGNLWEWCEDRYGPYPAGDIEDPKGSDNGSARVLCGGSWSGHPRFCRSASRRRGEPGDRGHNGSCRVCFCLD